jgi:protein-S-isoprenylcysteine O-methyltransferase Ste14
MFSLTPETTFRSLLGLLLISVLAMRTVFMLHVRQSGERILPDRAAIQREGRGFFWARVALFFLLMAFLVLYLAGSPALGSLGLALVPLPGWLRWLGFVVGLSSLGLWTMVQVTLGKQWSPQLQLRPEHHLVTSGPFARLRHPMYTAMVGYATGLALLSANWVFVSLALLTAVGLALRAPREERMMLETFGDEYRAYMEHAGRFLPRWR